MDASTTSISSFPDRRAIERRQWLGFVDAYKMATQILATPSSSQDADMSSRSHATQDAALDMRPPPSAQRSNDTDSTEFHGFDTDSAARRASFSYDNLMSIDDWEKENPYLPHSAKLVAVTPKEATGMNSSKFYTACIARGVDPVLTYNEAPPYMFSCIVQVGGQTYDFESSYASKKLAKERACEQVLQQWSSGALPDKKRKESSPSTITLDREAINEENWVGVLQSESYSFRKNMPLLTKACRTMHKASNYPCPSTRSTEPRT